MRIHQFDDSGKILRTINVGAEICGYTFANWMLYVLRGKENKDVSSKSEEWRIARLDVPPTASPDYIIEMIVQLFALPAPAQPMIARRFLFLVHLGAYLNRFREKSNRHSE